MRLKINFCPALMTLVLAVALFGAACRPAPRDPSTLRIAVTPVPHAAMVQHIAPLLADAGITLRPVVMQDYVQPNLRVDGGDIEANFFQTAAYFEDFRRHNKTGLVSAGSVHVEPFALFSTRHQSIDALPRGARVAVPADASNQHRALVLLARAGLIALPGMSADAPDTPGLSAIRDILRNPRELKFVQVEAAMLPRMLQDVDLAGINANFALAAGLRPAVDGLVVEAAEDGPYANIVAVRAELADSPAVLHLMQALRSDTMRAFIAQQYQGAVASLP